MLPAPPKRCACRTTDCTPSRGGRKGYWSVTVKANWRLVFRFENADVHDVELIDYH
jgi:plasmid maintenance system killer protein